eukprot:jgi/Mesvir1/21513/Mv03956-RA.1
MRGSSINNIRINPATDGGVGGLHVIENGIDTTQPVPVLTDASAPAGPSVYIWPLPQEVSHGDLESFTCVSRRLRFVVTAETKSAALNDACFRYRRIILAHVLHDGIPQDSSSEPDGCIQEVYVTVHSSDETLNQDTDESYLLTVPDNSTAVNLDAPTVYGALRGLETFSQLVRFNFTTRQAEVEGAPWVVRDWPRFSYRGLLLDTARHYQPVSVIKRVIDSLSYAKLNVLHWHMVDTQAFPVETPSFPRLWEASYTPDERYSVADMEEVVEYARRRGVRVVPEYDVPGHAASWGVGYPELWPRADCKEPLNPVGGLASQVIRGIISDAASVFKDGFFHLGGDEVNMDCWQSTPSITDWMAKHEPPLNAHDIYKGFVSQAGAAVRHEGQTPIHWQEVFDTFGTSLDKNTIVQIWLPNASPLNVIANGYRVIVSNSDMWYLDWLNVHWEKFYLNEPLAGIAPEALPQLAPLVLGGEVCMWSETADPSVLFNTIWPRAAAAAERLWSDPDQLHNLRSAHSRLEDFRCTLQARDIPAAPLNSPLGRTAPDGPGSCFDQRRRARTLASWRGDQARGGMHGCPGEKMTAHQGFRGREEEETENKMFWRHRWPGLEAPVLVVVRQRRRLHRTSVAR